VIAVDWRQLGAAETGHQELPGAAWLACVGIRSGSWTGGEEFGDSAAGIRVSLVAHQLPGRGLIP